MPKYASSDEEADKDLRAYCDSIGFDPEWIVQSQWEATIRIARNEEYGIAEAHNTIDKDKERIFKVGAREARKQKLDADASGLLAALKKHYSLKDTLVPGILQQCADAYVGGERVNLGLSGSPLDPGAYEELREEWRAAAKLAAGGVFTEFVSHAAQDKAALGKGNVGHTLAKRGVQGNLLVKIAGVRFNMHVDIDG
ncbi:hypothetical protein ACWEPM_38395 [Streptomyces sp. NPDC004244]|uniref:hypothetical protein n=1 Tax=Streptomyces sp. NPDC101206 TaxID=3366128 RepID=UPI003810B39E